ncbi:MAG: hypothetical protein MJK18_14375, partial [Bdellovibrionales bacterium]|nr:hypothetical protein [Bdellovibrionales bacterium]
MNFKIVGGIVICAVVVLFIFSGKKNLADESVKVAVSEHHDHSSHSHQHEEPEEDVADEALGMSDDESKDELSPMDKLFKKVGKLSMFDQRGLDELRLEAYQWMSENPKEFENFTLKKVDEAEKHSVESMFFFVEAYAKKHPNAAEGVNEIMNMHSHDSGHTKNDKEGGHSHSVGGTQKQNMTKAFALEVYFDRLNKEGGVDDVHDPAETRHGRGVVLHARVAFEQRGDQIADLGDQP